jgi:hypothetical protein
MLDILMGNYVIKDGKKMTYQDDVPVFESQEEGTKYWYFMLTFTSEGKAFEFFNSVRFRLSVFVPVGPENQTFFFAEFADGMVFCNLLDTGVVYTRFILTDL